MNLAIISHTEHFIDDNGQIVGWGPTVREAISLLALFDEIWHVAVLSKDPAPPSAIPYNSERIHFVPIQPFGGPTIYHKLGLLLQAPKIIYTVNKVLKEVDYWQFRAPTGIGVFLIPWLSIFVNKKGWFKYAGNWGQYGAPLGYKWQRWCLITFQKNLVTINGSWPNQPKHCLSFDNPCLDEVERKAGAFIVKNKFYNQKLNICFVGHLTKAKGADKILSALQFLPWECINEFHLVGNGPLFNKFKEIAEDFPLVMHGYLERDQVSKIMAKCHIQILPSESEGFPKVISEGVNYGCVPVVSDISAIGQTIINGIHGFLLDPHRLSNNYLAEDLSEILQRADLLEIANSAYILAERFTFKRYHERIKKEILNL